MVTSSPLVSIIVPTRNRKELLKYAITSVLRQTHSHLQIVIQDNFSQDGTEKMVRETFQDKRVEYYRSKKNLSMCENWDSAFSHIKGEYCVRLDDDNIFFPNFTKEALHQIKNWDLDIITFFPIIIHADRRIFPLFEIEEKTYLLNKYQLFYLEYMALTDSNYTVYKTKMLKHLFPEGPIFRSYLPDRYMNYFIASKMNKEHWRVGVNLSPKGITRFDYRPSYQPDYHLDFVDYNKSLGLLLKGRMNCHDNFVAHRIATLQNFFECDTSTDFKNYYHKNITSESFIITLLRIGHIRRIKGVNSAKEIRNYMKYVLLIMLSLSRYPFSKIEGQTVWPHLLGTAKRSFLFLSKSLERLFTRQTSPHYVVDPSFGENIIQDTLYGEIPKFYKLSPIYGRFENFIKNIP